MRRRGSSPVLSYSLSEFAFILLFLSMGSLAVLFTSYLGKVVELEAVTGENINLKEEVKFLNEILAEKENAIVPCWRRPEGLIPPLVGRIIIHSQGEVSVIRNRDEYREEILSGPDDIGFDTNEVLKILFREDRNYAKEKNCYIRIGMENRTNDFAVYHDLVKVLGYLGMVLVNE